MTLLPFGRGGGWGGEVNTVMDKINLFRNEFGLT